jgi:hypothetical protein
MSVYQKLGFFAAIAFVSACGESNDSMGSLSAEPLAGAQPAPAAVLPENAVPPSAPASVPPGDAPPAEVDGMPTTNPMEPVPTGSGGGPGSMQPTDGGAGGSGQTPPSGELPPEPEPIDPEPIEPVDPEQPPGDEVPGCQVLPITQQLRDDYDLDPFYQKHALARGVPVLASSAPADLALSRACELVVDMLSIRPDVVEALLERRTRFAIIGEQELTNDIPEYRNQPDSINTRARGLGGSLAGTCAEESILCNEQLDRWRGEGICVHEFAHTISTAGLYDADPSFADRLSDAFQAAQSAGLYANTYAETNLQEYWAEGVQNWYNTNLEANPPNGIHNDVDTREELLAYDAVLYELISELLPDETQFVDCYAD